MFLSRTRIDPRYCSIHHDRLDGHSSIVGELSSRHLDLPVLDLGMAFATPEGPARYIRIIEAWQENRKLRSYYCLCWFPTFNELNALCDNIISSHRSSMLVPVSSRCHTVGDRDVIARLISTAVPAKCSTHTLIFVYHLFIVLNHIFDYFLLKLWL